MCAPPCRCGCHAAERQGQELNVYYVADVRSVVGRSPALPRGVTVRPIVLADIPALAELYLRAYDLRDKTFGDAVAEMTSAFDGSWGALWPDASPAAWIGSELVAVVQAVRRPSREAMPDAPHCPWLIEVFTDPRHRRAGLARALMAIACGVMDAAGEGRVGLTVDEDNIAAVALYKSLGFSDTI